MELPFLSIQKMLESVVIEKINSIPDFYEKTSPFSIMTTLFDDAAEIVFSINKLGVKFEDILIVASGSRYSQIECAFDCPDCFTAGYKKFDKHWDYLEFVVKGKNNLPMRLPLKNLFFICPDGGEVNNIHIIRYLKEKTRQPRIVVALGVHVSESGKKEIDETIDNLKDIIDDVTRFKITDAEFEYHGFCAKF